MKITKLFSIILSLLLILPFSACNKSNLSNQETVSIIDMEGRQVVLPIKVENVFVSGASAIMLTATIGAVDKLVCKMPAFEEDTFAWARIICPDLSKVPTDEDAFTNVEAVLKYSPDVVITIEKSDIEKFSNIGLPVIYLNITSYETLKEALLIMGTILGEDELKAAQKYNEYFDNNVALVNERTSVITDDDKKSIYYVDSRFNDIYHTVGTGEIQGSWISVSGAKLATDGYFVGRNIEITAEQILSINPDIIMVGAQNQAEIYKQIISENRLSELRAINDNSIYRIPQGIFPWCRTGPEAALQVIWAGKLLHPELFEDIDVSKVAKDFYQTFYGVGVSDENIKMILEGRLTPLSE